MDTSFSRGSSLSMPALILGASVIAATVIVSGVVYQVKALGNTIAVTGSAEKTVSSDVAKWSSSFSRQVDASSLKRGYVDVKTDLDSVLAFFHERGITDKEVTIQPVSVSQVTECANSSADRGCLNYRLTGYTLSQQLIVEASDVQKVTKLAQDGPGTLIDKGIVFESQQPEYYIKNLANLKLDMLTEATASAKSRAEKIVQSTGASLGHLQSAGMGVFQVTQVNSTEISDYGTYDTTSIEKKVTAVVRASFTLD